MGNSISKPASLLLKPCRLRIRGRSCGELLLEGGISKTLDLCDSHCVFQLWTCVTLTVCFNLCDTHCVFQLVQRLLLAVLTSISALRKDLAAAVVASISAGEFPTVCSHLIFIVTSFHPQIRREPTYLLPSDKRQRIEAPRQLQACAQADVKD